MRLELFRDVVVGDFIGEGSINVACYAEVLPKWWWEREQHLFKPDQKFIMKLIADLGYAEKEIEAWQKLNANYGEARRHRILPLIAANATMTNPFYRCDSEKKDNRDTNCQSGTLSLPKSFPSHIRRYFSQQPRIAAFVVPFEVGKGSVFDEIEDDEDDSDDESKSGDEGERQREHEREHDGLPRLKHFRSLDDVRYFMKDMLGQLGHAHKVGINYLDLSGNRNVFASDDGGAVLFDWNGALTLGEKAYNSENNFAILPPEAWMEYVEVDGQQLEFKMASISAWDVWSAGVIFARLLFYPSCRWATDYTYPDAKDRLRETILAVGGNTIVPVDNEGHTVDFADVVGLDADVVRDVRFRPHLVDRSESRKCSKKGSTFQLLDGAGISKEEKVQALDFLRSMMTFSPLDRPDCDTLLKHPFLAVKRQMNERSKA